MKAKIKLCHVATASTGGISQMVLNLAEGQKNDPEFEVEIVLLGNGTWLGRYQALGIPLRVFDLNGRVQLVTLWSVVQQLNRYDVVHLHSFFPLLSLLLNFCRACLVYTCHGVQGAGRVSKRFALLRRFLFLRFLNRRVDFITFVSCYAECYWRKNGVENPNAKVIYNGCNLPYPDMIPAPAGELSAVLKNKFVVGTSSSFVKLKRVDLLIHAFADFAKNRFDTCLLLVGDGSERRSLEKLCRELNLENQVIFTGYRNDVASWQKAMNVAVFPSTTETFGLVAIELLNLGKPVICCRDGGGISEILAKFSDDVVEPSPEAIAERLEFYYCHREGIDSANYAKRRQYAETFNMERCQTQFSAIYKNFSAESSTV